MSSRGPLVRGLEVYLSTDSDVPALGGGGRLQPVRAERGGRSANRDAAKHVPAVRQPCAAAEFDTVVVLLVGRVSNQIRRADDLVQVVQRDRFAAATRQTGILRSNDRERRVIRIRIE